MKFKSIITFVVLVIITISLSAQDRVNSFQSVTVDRSLNPVVSDPSGCDDPQPDTLRYDDGTVAFVVTGIYDYYAGVRFTAPSDFEVRSVYLSVNNPNNNQIDDLIVTICADSNGIPGTALDSMVVPAPIGQGWQAVNLNTPLVFGLGEDFHVYYNAPGGIFPGGIGWWCSVDQMSNIDHTLISADGVTWNESVFDCLIRIGGEFSGMPEPLIELSTADVVFDSTMMGETDIEYITIINPSMLMDLTITGIEIDETIPPGVFDAIISNPPITIEPLSNLEIQLEFNPPIQIPAGGGSFNYDLDIVNRSITSYTIDVSIDVMLPGGTIYPVSSKYNIDLNPGAPIFRSLTQFIPGDIPAGNYLYNGHVYDHSTWELLSEDSFPFEKLPGDDSPNHNLGWALYGWDEGEPAVIAVPGEFVLYHAYPNPFNASTVISFELPHAGLVKLNIFDINGRSVGAQNFVPIRQWMPTGSHEVVFDGSDLASGVYFARLQAGDFNQTRKILLIK